MVLAGVPLWIWGAFMAFVAAMLALDLGVFHRKAHKVEIKEALVWSGVWIALALVFNLGVFMFWDTIQPGSTTTRNEAGFAFLTGYLIEKALSIDNIFVFILIFSYFNVPEKYQHKVLFWGIIGALAFRALFVAAGAVLLERFAWTMVVFGLFLVFTGVKMALAKDKKSDPGKNPVVRLVRRFIPVTDDYVGSNFVSRIGGKWVATPLLLVLLVVEFTDVIFAIDSVPAIFAITSEPFLVFTSNIFAILGLRSLFFALAGLVQKFHYLSYGLAAVLAFVGGKMIYGYVEKAIVPDLPKFPVVWSLGIIVLILAVSVWASLARSRRLETAMPH
ncbi:MAG: TerC family protein [Armatimonadetes bacterium]|nr:TerC family protein [Armatimonadota bacterium]